MVQVCAHCISLPVEKIHIMETSTDKAPNANPTITSVSSDLNGMAIKVGTIHDNFQLHTLLLLIQISIPITCTCATEVDQSSCLFFPSMFT